MIKYFENLGKNELVRGSFILILLVSIGNFLSYLFQFIMARMLGPSDFGILAVLTSLVAIFTFPIVSIQTIVSKHTTELMVKKSFGKINWMISRLTKKLSLVALACFIGFSIISIYLSKILGINYSLFLIVGLFIFGSFLYPIAAGVLQGLKRFKQLGGNFVINCAVKLVAAVILVYLGMKVYGAALGFVSGMFISFILLFPLIKDIRKYKKEKSGNIKFISRENFYTFFAMLLIVLLYSLDVIFVKAFFSSELAGRYSVISLIGKMILFVIMSVGNVMFPISSERLLHGGKTRSILNKALLLSFSVITVSILTFLIIPEFIVSKLFGQQYLALSPILPNIGIAFSCISLLVIAVLYKISIKKFKIIHLLALSAFLAIQIAFFFIFKQDISEFSAGFMASSLIALIGGIFALKKW